MTDKTTYTDSSELVPDELEEHLAAVERSSCYRAVAGLGRSAQQAAAGQQGVAMPPSGTITELVEFTGGGGAALGPYVRKRIDLALGVGSAYKDLYRIQREGVHLAHVPQIRECYTTGAELVVVSDYVQGETLAAYVARCGGSVETARAVMPPVCEAVAELHAAMEPPIVHRDLKPANIVVSRGVSGPFTTLIDFGIARRYRGDAVSDTVRFGTRSYAPPEQYGFGETSVRSDVYALGMLALFCVTGHDGASQPTASSLAAAGVPEDMAQVILRATSFDPAARYADAEDFARAFSGASAGGVGEKASDAGTINGAPTALTSVPDVFTGTPDEVAGTSHALDDAPDATSADFPSIPATASWLEAPRREGWWARNRIKLGYGYNALVILAVAVLVIALPGSEAHNPDGTPVPAWKDFYISYCMILPGLLGAGYLLLDRKSLATRFPKLAARRRLHDAVLYFFALMILLLIGVTVEVIVG